MEANEFIFRYIWVIVAKLAILEMGEEETEVGPVTEKRESYVIFIFIFFIISYVKWQPRGWPMSAETLYSSRTSWYIWLMIGRGKEKNIVHEWEHHIYGWIENHIPIEYPLCSNNKPRLPFFDRIFNPFINAWGICFIQASLFFFYCFIFYLQI